MSEGSRRARRRHVFERLGELAVGYEVRHVLVAGDVYDTEAPSPVTLRVPLERMKAFSEVHWHLLPGNHDPHRPEGVWDRLAQIGLPPNIHLHLTPTPIALEAHAFLLPAPQILGLRPGSGRTYGWWEAIVLDRKGDSFTLQYRDYPHLPKFVRHRSGIALMCPSDDDAKPAAEPRQA